MIRLRRVLLGTVAWSLLQASVALPAGGAASIIGVDAPPDQIYQAAGLFGPQAQVAVAATYTGTPGVIQATVFPFGGTGPAHGATWQALPASGGIASGTISVPRGGWYALAFRDTASSARWTSQRRISVGTTGAFYGQSNMVKLMTLQSTYEPFEPLARRQCGGGWNVVSNSSSDNPLPTVGSPVFAGITNAGLQAIAGEIGENQRGSACTGTAAAMMSKRLLASTGGPVGFHSYYAVGTSTAYWNPATGQGWDIMLGNTGSGRTGLFNKAPYTCAPSFCVRYQGEDDANAARYAGFIAALTTERDAWWALSARDTNTFRMGLVTLGSSSGYVAGYFGQIRAKALAFIGDAANGAFLAGNPVDLALDDNVHINTASAARLGYRIAVATARALGRPVSGSTGAFTTGSGPRVTEITRSGNVLTLTAGDMDGGTGLVTGDGGTSGAALTGFRVWTGRASGVPISGAAVGGIMPVSTAISGSTIVLTLPTGTAYPISLDNQMGDAPYGMPLLPARIPYGNNLVPGDTLGMPLRPFAAITVN